MSLSFSANLFNVGCKFVVIETHKHTHTHTYATKPGATFFFILNELQVVTLAHTAFIRAFCERACLCLIRMTLSELSFYEV